jgi:hypothetical protein
LTQDESRIDREALRVEGSGLVTESDENLDLLTTSLPSQRALVPARHDDEGAFTTVKSTQLVTEDPGIINAIVSKCSHGGSKIQYGCGLILLVFVVGTAVGIAVGITIGGNGGLGDVGEPTMSPTLSSSPSLVPSGGNLDTGGNLDMGGERKSDFKEVAAYFIASGISNEVAIQTPAAYWLALNDEANMAIPAVPPTVLEGLQVHDAICFGSYLLRHDRRELELSGWFRND